MGGKTRIIGRPGQRAGYSEYPNGILLNFVDPNTTLETTGAHVVSQNPPFSDSPGFGEQVVLTFDQDLPALAAGVALVYGDFERI